MSGGIWEQLKKGNMIPYNTDKFSLDSFKEALLAMSPLQLKDVVLSNEFWDNQSRKLTSYKFIIWDVSNPKLNNELVSIEWMNNKIERLSWPGLTEKEFKLTFNREYYVDPKW